MSQAESTVVSDYIIKKRRLVVHNADDALLETGKPMVPVFVREIMLPKGSGVEDVDFRGFYRTYRGLELPVIPWDEHFVDRCDREFDGIANSIDPMPEESSSFFDNGIAGLILTDAVKFRAFAAHLCRVQGRAAERAAAW